MDATISRGARNAALDATGCDWCLVLDADEWLGRWIEAWRGCAEAEPTAFGLMPVASLVEAQRAGVHEAPSWLPRLLPRGVSLQGRVHEQPRARCRAGA